MNQPNRILWVDIAKGIGIILVVSGHMIDGSSKLGMYIWSFHMPLFFFLSGLFMSSTLSLQSVKKRARQLLLPCFIFTVISCAVQYFILGNTLDSLSHSLPVPLWFLTTLFLADLMSRCLSPVLGIPLLILFCLIGSMLCQYFDYGTVYSLSSVFPASAFYLIGYTYRSRKMPLGGGNSSVLLLVTFLLLPVLVISFNNHTNLDSNRISLIGYIIALLGIVQTILVSKLISKTKIMSTTLSYLGRNSLVIMLTHFIYLQLYCHFVHEFSPFVIYKALQALVVFGLSIASIHAFQGRLAILVGKNLR